MKASPVDGSDPTGWFAIETGTKRDSANGQSRNPTAGRGSPNTTGATYDFDWTLPSDGIAFYKRVTDWGYFRFVDEKGRQQSVHWDEAFREVWVSGRDVAGSVQRGVQDTHKAGPEQPAVSLERTLGMEFHEAPGNRLKAKYKDGREEWICEWQFYLKAEFTVTNTNADAALMTLEPRFIGAYQDSWSTDGDDRFRKMLLPNRRFPRLAAWPWPPAVNGRAYTSTDEWDIYWESGMASRAGQYTGGYQ